MANGAKWQPGSRLFARACIFQNKIIRYENHEPTSTYCRIWARVQGKGSWGSWWKLFYPFTSCGIIFSIYTPTHTYSAWIFHGILFTSYGGPVCGIVNMTDLFLIPSRNLLKNFSIREGQPTDTDTLLKNRPRSRPFPPRNEFYFIFFIVVGNQFWARAFAISYASLSTSQYVKLRTQCDRRAMAAGYQNCWGSTSASFTDKF